MKDRIENRIARIRDYIKILYNIKGDCKEKFLKDPVYKGAVLHYLYLTADSCISVAEAIIRHRGLRTPLSYSEAIDILGENNIIPPDFAYEFTKIASFRNLLAHDYEKIDYIKICEDAFNKLSDIIKYLEFVEQNY